MEWWAAVAAAKGGQTTYLGQEQIKAAGVTSALVFVVLSSHPYVSGKHYERKLYFEGKQDIYLSGVLVILATTVCHNDPAYNVDLPTGQQFTAEARIFLFHLVFISRQNSISLVRIAPWWHILIILTRLATSAPSLTAPAKWKPRRQ